MTTLLAGSCVWVGVSGAIGMLLILALVAGTLLLKGGSARLAVLALSLTTLAGCAHADGPVVVMPRPAAELRTVSRVAFGPYAEFLFRLVLDQPLSCPEIAWDCGDGRKGSRESDCEPDELGARVYERWCVYRSAGDFVAVAQVKYAGRTVATSSLTVTVIGRGGNE